MPIRKLIASFFRPPFFSRTLTSFFKGGLKQNHRKTCSPCYISTWKENSELLWRHKFWNHKVLKVNRLKEKKVSQHIPIYFFCLRLLLNRISVENFFLMMRRRFKICLFLSNIIFKRENFSLILSSKWIKLFLHFYFSF